MKSAPPAPFQRASMMCIAAPAASERDEDESEERAHDGWESRIDDCHAHNSRC